MGHGRLTHTTESGEKLYPNTAAEGREVVRQQLRTLRADWDKLFDDVSTSQRKLESGLSQWSAFDDSFAQVEKWSAGVEGQLKGGLVLKSTLEEKKAQLLAYKVIILVLR